MRNVELNFEDPGVDVKNAVAYLSMWSYTRFDTVRIYNDRGNDLIAHYSQSEGDSTYVIGAVYNEESGKYSFHS